MNKLTNEQLSVINTVLFSVEHCWEKDDNDYYSTDDFICVLSEKEYKILMKLVKTGI